ncbi:hypothetical protein C3B55_00396 [Candidatus Pseudomonas adelgestsugas]|uniref:Uncharacterized protein n=1 Tax=Candidatus Pseudomonas adelgestsugas TaxID=1302376 RepID=A0ABX5R7W4_9PSED|nr:hypothetical protein C3B55_00396 [Candidatus Pseudomonas adelgestsugas]
MDSSRESVLLALVSYKARNLKSLFTASATIAGFIWIKDYMASLLGKIYSMPPCVSSMAQRFNGKKIDLTSSDPL